MRAQVVNALIIVDGAIAMAQHPESQLWTFPGGKVEAGETPREGLIRELGEELPEFLVESFRYYHTLTGITPTSQVEAEFLFYLVEGRGSINPGAELEHTKWSVRVGELETTKATTTVLNMLRGDGLI